MSPRTLPPADLIEESKRIKRALLSVEAEARQAAKSSRTAQTKDLRDKLGYSAAETANTDQLVDNRIASKVSVITPDVLAEALPLTKKSAVTTDQSRQNITKILAKKDDRLIVIVGPCSIHNPESALEYAQKIVKWRQQYGDSLEIIMRSYMEKPRTEKGWKGLVYDPLLDESDDINLGLVLTRLLSYRITDLGVPIAMERLNALTPQYLNGLVAYDTIGARNTTDQKSREYASGTSSPVGFKNTPEGSVLVAVQAIIAAKAPHAFLGMSTGGVVSQINTTGNPTGHVILRGDKDGPNYSADHIANLKALLSKHELAESILVDASHGNSGKQAAKQPGVVADVARQVASGEAAICGVIIESNLVAGSQNLKNTDGTPKSASELTYGQSITDDCVGLADTDAMLANLAQAAQTRRQCD